VECTKNIVIILCELKTVVIRLFLPVAITGLFQLMYGMHIQKLEKGKDWHALFYSNVGGVLLFIS